MDILELRAPVDLPEAIRGSRIDDEIAGPPDLDAVDYVPVAQRVHHSANLCAPFASRHGGELAHAAAPKFGSPVSADKAQMTELEGFLADEKEKLARAGSSRTWIFMSIAVGFLVSITHRVSNEDILGNGCVASLFSHSEAAFHGRAGNAGEAVAPRP